MSSLRRDVFDCVMSGDLEAVQQCFEREAAAELDPFGMKDEAGRNALLIACMLGKSAIARELVGHGARVNEHTARGYSSLHLAACWGHVETVRTLLELGADPQAETFRGQRAVDLARTYCRTHCVDCLLTAEAKQDLMSYVGFVQDLVSDPERSLTTEEKRFCHCACSAKTDWIQRVRNPTASDFTAQKRDMEDTLRPILHKLSAQYEQDKDKGVFRVSRDERDKDMGVFHEASETASQLLARQTSSPVLVSSSRWTCSLSLRPGSHRRTHPPQLLSPLPSPSATHPGPLEEVVAQALWVIS